MKYQNYLETTPTRLGKPMAPNSINRKISSISSFYQFLLQREIVDKNPVEFCNRPKRINVSDTEAFNDAEMKRFFQLIARKSATSTPGNTTTALYDGNEKSRG